MAKSIYVFFNVNAQNGSVSDMKCRVNFRHELFVASLSEQKGDVVLLCVSLTYQALFARRVRGEGARVREPLSAMLAVERLLSRVDALVFLRKMSR